LYNQKAKVYDCFYFFNELDLLEIRLNILNDHVDYFVLIEATSNFLGEPKDMIFAKNRERYAKFLHKIIYYEISSTPMTRDEVSVILENPHSSPELKTIAKRTLTTPNIPTTLPNSRWVIEYYQKESLLIALRDLDADDTVYVSDLDEIWNPKLKFSISKSKIYIFKQVPYIYFFNNKSNEFWHEWTGTIVTKFGTLKKYGVNECRTHNRLTRFVIRKGGWHFSFQGGAKAIEEKLNSYPHLEYSTKEIREKIPEMISSLKHLKGQQISFHIDDRNLPEYLVKHRDKYDHYFLKS
jgi:beta-1,4-mannosyl-glycoprotein beta-1,4-N-acetylglucosaminyltransferase